MIQKWLTKYGLFFHVACICVLPVFWLFQMHADRIAAPLLWLSLAAAEMMLLLPSVHRSETLADARRRVVTTLAWDPFFYTGLVLIAIAVAQWLNSGCKLVYLPDADVWQISQPPVPWAPFSVHARAAFLQVAVFTACVTMGVILRTALSKGSKRMLLQTLACLSGIAALYGVVQVYFNVQPWSSLTTGWTPPMVGAFFGFWLLMGQGLFVEARLRGQRGGAFLFLLGVFGNLFGVLFFSSVFSLLVYILFAGILFIYTLVFSVFYVSKTEQFKIFLLHLLTIGILAGGLFYLYPRNPVGEKAKAVLSLPENWARFSAPRKARADAAIAIWQEHPWAGVGADGFNDFVGLAVNTKNWRLIKEHQPYALNDWLQFLSENGAVGTFFLLVLMVCLMVPVCSRARLLSKPDKDNFPESHSFMFRASPVAVSGSLALVACLLESCMGNPFRSAAMTLSWIGVLASLPAFLSLSVEKMISRK